MHLLLYFGLALLTLAAWHGIALYRSYKQAKSIGLPILISPTGTLNPLWIILYKALPVIPLLQRLPFNLGRWAKYTYMGWQFDDKHAIHEELGPAFVLCTPGLNEVVIADPSAVHTLLNRRKEFIKPSMMYEPLNVFGRNLDAVEGDTWQRHRKLTAPNFNERVSGSVWSEATQQAHQMLQEWIACGAKGSKNVVDDTAALALHVLTYAGFGIRYAFKDAQQKLDPPHRLTYRDALLLVLRNFTLLVMVPMKLMTWPIMPCNIRKVGEACSEFKLYMKEMVEAEKKSAADRSNSERSNLLSALVHASEAVSEAGQEKGSRVRSGLADDELYGNLFIYNMAGHESTANTIATSIAYLAAAPRWQKWVHEEVRQVTAEQSAEPQNWVYEDVYPRLRRCQAIQLETLRLHGSTVFLPKSTGNSSCTLAIAGKEHVIPPSSFVVTNSQALHCDPKTWGADALEWKPNRWIRVKNPGSPVEEELVEPAAGTFVGWADGPRACPGKKFSQVEFAGVMAVLFGRHSVKPRREDGESEDLAAGRLYRMIEDSAITAVTLQMKSPRDVALIWEEVL